MGIMGGIMGIMGGIMGTTYNEIIFFLAYCCFSYGTCTLFFFCIYIYIVSCHNYMYYFLEHVTFDHLSHLT